jgi:hypothetical protein
MFNLVGIQAKIAEWLIVIAVVAGAAWFTYNAGYNSADDAWKVAQATSNQKAQARYEEVATKLENTKAERIIQTNTITKIVPQIVEREIYKNVCIDEQGLAVANKALKGEAYEAPK